MKKGFTLVELLAVVVILGILLGFAAPAVFKTLNKNKEKVFKIQEKTFAEAAKLMYEDCMDEDEEGDLDFCSNFVNPSGVKCDDSGKTTDASVDGDELNPRTHFTIYLSELEENNYIESTKVENSDCEGYVTAKWTYDACKDEFKIVRNKFVTSMKCGVNGDDYTTPGYNDIIR